MMSTRGITLEFLLTRLRTLNPVIQIIGLSATIQNANELAQWLDADLVTDTWQPVPLKEGYYQDNTIFFKDLSQRKVVAGNVEPVTALALDMIKEGGQVLIFANTRRNAVQYCEESYVTQFISQQRMTKKQTLHV